MRGQQNSAGQGKNELPTASATNAVGSGTRNVRWFLLAEGGCLLPVAMQLKVPWARLFLTNERPVGSFKRKITIMMIK